MAEYSEVFGVAEFESAIKFFIFVNKLTKKLIMNLKIYFTRKDTWTKTEESKLWTLYFICNCNFINFSLMVDIVLVILQFFFKYSFFSIYKRLCIFYFLCKILQNFFNFKSYNFSKKLYAILELSFWIFQIWQKIYNQCSKKLPCNKNQTKVSVGRFFDNEFFDKLFAILHPPCNVGWRYRPWYRPPYVESS